MHGMCLIFHSPRSLNENLELLQLNSDYEWWMNHCKSHCLHIKALNGTGFPLGNYLEDSAIPDFWASVSKSVFILFILVEWRGISLGTDTKFFIRNEISASEWLIKMAPLNNPYSRYYPRGIWASKIPALRERLHFCTFNNDLIRSVSDC